MIKKTKQNKTKTSIDFFFLFLNSTLIKQGMDMLLEFSSFIFTRVRTSLIRVFPKC